MEYRSTRGEAPPLGFRDVLLAGLAGDGGLYLPATWPKVTAEEIAGFAARPYADVAADIVGRYAEGEIAAADLRRMATEAYTSFRHPAVVPLIQMGPNDWLLELFRGPTLAFKDLAMQLLSRLMDHVLAGSGRRVTILGATSGDTGGAAIEAFRGRANIDVFILFPRGRVSDVQRRQMTTVPDANIHALAVEGSFDDCQALVKRLFGLPELRRRLSLAAVNSINWARIVAQIPYYFTAAAALGAPGRRVAFTVPTGNFGDIFAGYAAAMMGLPVERLVIATNANDILARTLATGRYEVKGVAATTSPSMDIEVSSNFERLLAEAYGRNGAAVRRLMAGLAQSGAFTVEPGPLAKIKELFAAGRADEADTAAAIRNTYAASGYLADPHTAVGLAVAAKNRRPGVPMVTLATADPAKFPDAVEAASGRRPTLPDALADLMDRPERVTDIANDAAALEKFLVARSRAGVETV